MWPFSRKRPTAPSERWGLSTPLLHLSQNDVWTVGDACQGCQVFGSTGSGKSTASVAAIVKAFLKADFGGLFLTVKPEDRETYEGYCRETGRSEDLLVFGLEEHWRFNALDAELQRRDAGAGLTENVVGLLTTLLEVSERDARQGGGDDSGYWRRANRQLMRNAVDLLVMAKERLSIPLLYRLAVSAPVSPEQLASTDWKERSFCFECLREADAKTKSPQQQADFELVADFFAVEWVNLSERTRSVVLSTFTSMLDVLNRGAVRELMSAPVTNISPEMAQDGKIILIDLPLKVFGEVGVYVQVMWKFLLQRAQERRDVRKNARPVFIASDESHLTALRSDQAFQTTARSSRAAVLFATQSISNYLAAFGDKAEAEVHSLLGNLQLKVFHQQADIKTNAYAAELIGRSRQFLINSSSSRQPADLLGSLFGQRPSQCSAGVTETFEWDVQPTAFATLRKGGPPHWLVDALVYQGGRRFDGTNRCWLPVTFRQHL
jgi:type IV secretory pathway TraG/TraD family ATPase VirD4